MKKKEIFANSNFEIACSLSYLEGVGGFATHQAKRVPGKLHFGCMICSTTERISNSVTE